MEFDKKTLFFVTICLLKFVVCQETCSGDNSFVNNPTVLKEMDGVYFKVYSTAQYPFGNQLYKFKPDPANNAIRVHGYDDSGCCTQANLSTVLNAGDYYDAVHSTLSGCPIQSSETITFKPLLTNTKHNHCFVVWVCLPSRQGVYVYCKKQEVSPNTLEWIENVAENLKITFVPFVQNISHVGHSCIANF